MSNQKCEILIKKLKRFYVYIYIYVTVLKDSRGNENVPKDIKRPLGKLVKA